MTRNTGTRASRTSTFARRSPTPSDSRPLESAVGSSGSDPIKRVNTPSPPRRAAGAPSARISTKPPSCRPRAPSVDTARPIASRVRKVSVGLTASAGTRAEAGSRGRLSCGGASMANNPGTRFSNRKTPRSSVNVRGAQPRHVCGARVGTPAWRDCFNKRTGHRPTGFPSLSRTVPSIAATGHSRTSNR